MKIVLFGTGQVGQALVPVLTPLGQLAVYGHVHADFEHPERVASVIASERPDLIVNAAAYTAVDKAEFDRDRAFRVNAEAVDAIGRAARASSAFVVHYSTDYVFDGNKGVPYLEDDDTNPQSVYGASKLAGESALIASRADHLNLRICWVHSLVGNSFPLSVLKLARERDSLEAVTDQTGIPTSAYMIAEITGQLIPHVLANRKLGGTYHLAARGGASRYAIARHVVAAALTKGADLKLTLEDIHPASSAQFPTPAPRPRDSRLDTAKLRARFGFALPTWQSGIEDLVARLAAAGRL
ncbi:MAG TPA: dTDP-4-dehydrorhamnose reductase [Devosia sp.]|nr:dTDP-4-dehydrorhamnose reductase [Devosia sp.]